MELTLDHVCLCTHRAHWRQELGFCPTYHRINQLSDRRPANELARLHCETHYLESEAVRSRIQEAISEDQKVYSFVVATIFPRPLAAYQGKLEVDLRDLQQGNGNIGRLTEPIWSRVMWNCIYKPLLDGRIL